MSRSAVAPRFSAPVAPPVVSPHADPPESTSDPQPVTTTADLSRPNITATNVHYAEAFKPKGLLLDQVSVEDCDRLWDLTRSDPDGTSTFLGVTFANSRKLFTYIENLAASERKQEAAFYAIRESDALIGFVILHPIYHGDDGPIATTHIYLEPDSRGRLQSLLPSMMAEADRLAPNTHLRVITQRQEWATMLKSVGFESHLVLTRKAQHGRTSGN